MTKLNFKKPLIIIAIVSAVMNFAGFSTVLPNDLFQLSLAALTSVGVFTLLYGFWDFAFYTMPTLQKSNHRLLGWGVMAVGGVFILGISAYWNIIALAGVELQKITLHKTVLTAEQSLSAAISQSGAYKKLPPQVMALSVSVGKLAKGEVESGAISGRAGKGGVSKTLYQIKGKVDAVNTLLQLATKEVDKLSFQGQTCLLEMRAAIGSQNSSEGVSASVDCVNKTIAGLNNQAVAEQAAQALSAITQGIVIPTSIKTKSQRDTVSRILLGIQDQANGIAAFAALIKTSAGKFVSNERPNIMEAVLIHWKSIIPTIATAVAIDLLPVLLLIFKVLLRRDDEALGRNTSEITLGDLERGYFDLLRIKELSNQKAADNNREDE